MPSGLVIGDREQNINASDGAHAKKALIIPGQAAAGFHQGGEEPVHILEIGLMTEEGEADSQGSWNRAVRDIDGSCEEHLFLRFCLDIADRGFKLGIDAFQQAVTVKPDFNIRHYTVSFKHWAVRNDKLGCGIHKDRSLR